MVGSADCGFVGIIVDEIFDVTLDVIVALSDGDGEIKVGIPLRLKAGKIALGAIALDAFMTVVLYAESPDNARLGVFEGAAV